MKQFHLSNIIKKETYYKKAIIRILMARGFLIDEYEGNYYLSDNSTMDDLEYLKRGMAKYCLGNVIDDGRYVTRSRRNWDKNDISRNYTYKNIQPKRIEIIISDSATIDAAIDFFHSVGRNGSEAGPNIRTWREYSIEVFGNKVSVEQLEAYVAFYVKAVSACGVYTCFSCDGNHEDGGRIYVDSDYPSSIWHENIWNYIIKPRFGDIPYIGYGIYFDEDNQAEVYEIVYEIAAFLYTNRYKIRELKKFTLENFTKKYLDTHCIEVIEKYYQAECEKVLVNEKLI